MKFILTDELGRLTKWLRILGFDAVYTRSMNRSELIINSLREARIILTRDARMSPVSGIRLLRIEHDDVRDQLKQTIESLGIKIDETALFTRCVICNSELKQIEKEKIKAKVPEYVYDTQREFVACAECGRVYWHGTHWGNVRKLLAEIKTLKTSDERRETSDEK
jgi:uncharacterized protein with PIN domain